VAGLYRGFPVSCLGIFLYRGCFFGFYDSLKPLVIREDMQHNFFALFALGWFVDVTAGMLTYPVDTVRRRMMMTVGQSKEQRYKNAWQAFTHMWFTEGPRAFYNGGATNVVRSVAGALVLAAFDEFTHLYDLLRSH
jgi:solute carrier family 25 (mitochondrial adenine nucleotide translocator), member 4/5/6/31